MKKDRITKECKNKTEITKKRTICKKYKNKETNCFSICRQTTSC